MRNWTAKDDAATTHSSADVVRARTKYAADRTANAAKKAADGSTAAVAAHRRFSGINAMTSAANEAAAVFRNRSAVVRKTAATSNAANRPFRRCATPSAAPTAR